MAAFAAKHFHASSSKSCGALFSEPILIWNVSFVFSRPPLLLLFLEKDDLFSPFSFLQFHLAKLNTVCQNPETVLVVSERPTMALSSHGLSWRVFLLSLLFRIFISRREKKKKPREPSPKYAGSKFESPGSLFPCSSSLEGDICISINLRVGVRGLWGTNQDTLSFLPPS